jgi:DnaJ-class molecular chaperone
MATSFQDYYAVLGVPKTATEKEIKAAFRKLARKHHPDVNPGDRAAEDTFKKVSEAYEVLGDPEKRKKYDEVGEHWRDYEAWEKAGKPGQDPLAGFRGFPGGGQAQYRTVSPDDLEDMFGSSSPFSGFFNDLFGPAGGAARDAGRTAARSRRGSDVEGTSEITLEEAYAGTKRTIELSGPAGTRRVEVSIPAGIADGARVRATGQGEAGSAGGSAGDLYIRVRVRPDPRFVRDGDTLRTRVAVPLDTALLGGGVEVPTLRGKPVHLTIPPETQNGARLRLRGLGMPGKSGPGDLIAEVDLRLPLPLTRELREWAERLRGGVGDGG